MPNDEPRSLWDLFGDPQGVATYWLGEWLAGRNAGLPDLYANSRVLWTDARTNETTKLTFAHLNGQPFLTSDCLVHLVREVAGRRAGSERTSSQLLGDAIGYLARDFESLLSIRRIDAATPALLRAYARAVREAQSVLVAEGTVDPSAKISGWSDLAAIAYSLHSALTPAAAHAAAKLPPPPASCSSYAALEAYLGLLAGVASEMSSKGDFGASAGSESRPVSETRSLPTVHPPVHPSPVAPAGVGSPPAPLVPTRKRPRRKGGRRLSYSEIKLLDFLAKARQRYSPRDALLEAAGLGPHGGNYPMLTRLREEKLLSIRDDSFGKGWGLAEWDAEAVRIDDPRTDGVPT